MEGKRQRRPNGQLLKKLEIYLKKKNGETDHKCRNKRK